MRMTKKLALLGAVMGVAVFLSGCGQKAAVNKEDQAADAKDKAVEQKADAADQNSDQPSESLSLKDLMSEGKSLECAWSTKDEKGNSISGTVDVSGSKFKMIVQAPDQAGTGTANFYTLNDGTWIYSWGDMAKGAGVKMKAADAEQAGKDVQPDGSAGMQGNAPAAGGPQADWQKNYEYDCDPWEATDSAFAVPTDVKFMDAASFMKGIGDAKNIPNMPNGSMPGVPNPVLPE
ncbi:MAG: hypothetical protein HGB08_02615 [Candidatus Moranbacteria bacterium]|nr:hypothetical protein [Candidatus Moranbacteria bacterium]